MYLDISQVAPPFAPDLEKSRIIGLHELEAPIKVAVVNHPAVDVPESVRQHASMSGGSLVDGLRSGKVPLDHHIEHA